MIHFPPKYPLKTFIYPSRKEPEINYDVELWENGEIFCDCPAGAFRKHCRHKTALMDRLCAEFGGIMEACQHYKNIINH